MDVIQKNIEKHRKVLIEKYRKISKISKKDYKYNSSTGRDQAKLLLYVTVDSAKEFDTE